MYRTKAASAVVMDICKTSLLECVCLFSSTQAYTVSHVLFVLPAMHNSRYFILVCKYYVCSYIPTRALTAGRTPDT